jgi:hypothetical protein
MTREEGREHVGHPVKNVIEKPMCRGDVPPTCPHDEDGSSRVARAASIVSLDAPSDVELPPLEECASGDDLPHNTD